MFPNQIKAAVQSWLKQVYGKQSSIITEYPAGGGSINQALRLKTTSGDFFIKYNSRSKYPEMFSTEKKGLQLLDTTQSLIIPKVKDQQDTADYSYLLLEWMDSAAAGASSWEEAGHKLAQLHQHSAPQYGLQYDNYIGSLPQVNTPESDWINFLLIARLEPLMKQAFDAKLLNRTDYSDFEKLSAALSHLIPMEKPALLHGDLWSGNFMFTPAGPCVIDPAVYYGHREMDIGMTRLFGGFSTAFYEAYNSMYPLEKQWEQRIELNQLYPLLVHVNLFGSGYVAAVRSIFKRYT